MAERVLQKFIADSGYCSRRRAEELIANGRVKVNGEVAEPGRKVNDRDRIQVDGRPLSSPSSKIYIKLYKPAGYVCTNKKFAGEKNIFDLVKVKERLFVAGRLDKDSRGLVVLTNDGEWVNKITHPSFGCEKEYHVQVSRLNNEILKSLRKGVDIGDEGMVRTKEAEKIDDSTIKIVLEQGKKRQIRRMLSAGGAKVKDLKRVRIHNIGLGKLKEGEWTYF